MKKARDHVRRFSVFVISLLVVLVFAATAHAFTLHNKAPADMNSGIYNSQDKGATDSATIVVSPLIKNPFQGAATFTRNVTAEARNDMANDEANLYKSIIAEANSQEPGGGVDQGMYLVTLSDFKTGITGHMVTSASAAIELTGAEAISKTIVNLFDENPAQLALTGEHGVTAREIVAGLTEEKDEGMMIPMTNTHPATFGIV